MVEIVMRDAPPPSATSGERGSKYTALRLEMAKNPGKWFRISVHEADKKAGASASSTRIRYSRGAWKGSVWDASIARNEDGEYEVWASYTVDQIPRPEPERKPVPEGGKRRGRPPGRKVTPVKDSPAAPVEFAS